ncbi:MAG: hypothetical protein K2X37_05000 [Chitinophagaceae bacterium]|nr:hypothetical protein [Chitinophagaceae bacterium]
MIIIVGQVAFNSCRKTSNDTVNDLAKDLPEPNPITSYFNMLKTSTDGAFGLKSYSTANQNPKSNVLTSQLGGMFADKYGNTIKGGIVTIGSYQLEANSQHGNLYGFDKIQGDELYGTVVKFKLTLPVLPLSNTSSSGGSGTVL